ncbi:hypothetical protein F5Y19DRAFT_458844 [Xylariaceae sp. FL1651]|nr:hypothetical protein F5Y19DRAFT_458844 [Xylariaceae sp. FL1651]
MITAAARTILIVQSAQAAAFDTGKIRQNTGKKEGSHLINVLVRSGPSLSPLSHSQAQVPPEGLVYCNNGTGSIPTQKGTKVAQSKRLIMA